jgi:carboxypeptidase Taq
MKSYLKLKDTFKQLADVSAAQSILGWDEAVMMPVGAGEERGNTLAALDGMAKKFLVNTKNKKLLADAKQAGNRSEWDEANFKLMEKSFILDACIPHKLAEKIVLQSTACEQAWRQLRSQNNWREFRPYLEAVFKSVKEIARRRGEVLQLSPYDAMLDQYAPGFNEAGIDHIFSGLKEKIPALIQKITAKQSEDIVQVPQGPFDIQKQKELGMTAMTAMQFDFQRGRLDESHHPFCGGTPSDVRITTRYNENEFMSSLQGVCHETGHGLYEQGLPREWLSQPVGHIHSMAMHESQSLLMEKEVCCSESFFKFLHPHIVQQFGSQDAFEPNNLYKLVTRVIPDFIRVDADEVTYQMHIVLRYELEKSLFAGDISIKDLPEHWDALMQKYLGISTHKNYKDGVMQDVHWPSGAFGYFPAYALGRMIAAQFFASFLKAEPEFFEDLERGDFSLLKTWLNENIYSQASLRTPNDLLMKVTGSALDPEYFIKHVQRRYLGE